MPKKYVLWFNQIDKGDIDIVGGKGANLGEMMKAGFPVPNGFIVTAQAYFHFLDQTNLRQKIQEGLEGLDVGNSKALEKAAAKVQKSIIRSEFPKEIARDILSAYFKLDTGLLKKHALVAVRSSATAEDLPSASFAGQQSTFLNVLGEANLVEKVKEAWASLFTARAIFYRTTNKFDHFKVGIAVPVQKMVEASHSGVMFTLDPVTNDKSKVVIEAIYGLGEMIVQGEVTPDHYEVDKKTLRIIAKKVHTQEKLMRKKASGNEIISIPKREAGLQKISDKQIVAIANLGIELEKHYYFPQDSEWAIEKGKIYLVQTRPVTTLHPEKRGSGQAISDRRVYPEAALLLKGDPASPGLASGPVKILNSPKEIGKVISGDVLVAEMTNPDYVPAMKKAVAIVTERGGRTSHAAIVSRELGIPAVVGASGARKTLRDGQIITVNGSLGEIYKGAIQARHETRDTRHEPTKHLKTATHVYLNMAEPDRAQKYAKLPVDGVGLLRAEFMIAQIGTHPKKFIADKKEKDFVSGLANGIEAICEAFNPRPVIYRASDFRTNEFRNLKGGEAFEPKEENPMLGFRGASRYIADSRVFELELQAILDVRNKKNLKNLSLMIPFVRSPQELLAVKKIVTTSGLARSNTFHLWMMVEIPTNVIRIQDYLDVGIDGISFGSNDLTMLVLGVDRDNSEVTGDYSEMDPALLWSFERVINACLKAGVTTSMCGQAPSDFPQLVDKLVFWGITSVSVAPDVVNEVRETVYEAEKKLVLKK